MLLWLIFTVDQVFDLFDRLGATEEQLDFPVLYASGRSGWADDSLEGPRKDLSALFRLGNGVKQTVFNLGWQEERTDQQTD